MVDYFVLRKKYANLCVNLINRRLFASNAHDLRRKRKPFNHQDVIRFSDVQPVVIVQFTSTRMDFVTPTKIPLETDNWDSLVANQ